MARLLVHIAAAPQDATRLALGLLVARTALQQGHDVDVFVAGDAVHMLNSATRGSVQGLGTGNAANTGRCSRKAARGSSRRACRPRHAAWWPKMAWSLRRRTGWWS